MNSFSISVAIIDDDDLYRSIMAKVLQRSGISVIFQANNGKSGIDQIKDCLPLPLVVILDLEMPFMNGFETVKRLKTDWPQVAIVIHSSIMDQKTIDLLINSGVDAFISKTAGIRQLARTIKQMPCLSNGEVR